MAIIHGDERAPNRLFGEEVKLTPEHILSVGKSMLVGALKANLNVSESPEAAEYVTRVIVCPHCPRSIVEYGADSLPSRHHGNLNEAFLAEVASQNLLVLTPCNHHGGDSYDPAQDLQIRV